MAWLACLLAWLALAVTEDPRGGAGGLLLLPGVRAASSPSPRGFAPVAPERETGYGRVRGRTRTLHFLGGRQVERYLGVPYASPPVGHLRLEVSQCLLLLLLLDLEG